MAIFLMRKVATKSTACLKCLDLVVWSSPISLWGHVCRKKSGAGPFVLLGINCSRIFVSHPLFTFAPVTKIDYKTGSWNSFSHIMVHKTHFCIFRLRWLTSSYDHPLSTLCRPSLVTLTRYASSCQLEEMLKVVNWSFSGCWPFDNIYLCVDVNKTFYHCSFLI